MFVKDKTIRKLVCSFLAGMLVSFNLGSAHAVNIGLDATIRNRAASVDGNGLQLTRDDTGEKVFEIMGSATAAIVTDEANVSSAVASGVLTKICVSSGATTDFAIAFDSAAASGNDVNTTGRRLGPPVNRIAASHNCQTLNAQFHRGLVGLNNNTSGSSYFYYRLNGDRK